MSLYLTYEKKRRKTKTHFMKRLALKFLSLSLLAAIALPSFAQEDKVKEKEKKNTEQIIITLKGDQKEKVVIEINGDKVLVNGKPSDELKDSDIKVMRNKFKTLEGLSAYSVPRAGGTAWNFNMDNHNGFRYFNNMDENRAMLGVVTEEAKDGAEVTDVTEESAAAKAGIKEGDVISKVGDMKIENPDDLTEAIRKHKPGDKVTITLQRNKQEQKVTAELGKWKGVSAFSFTPGQNYNIRVPEIKMEDFVPGIPRVAPYGQNWAWAGGAPRLGLSVQDTDDGKGVKVIEVDEEGNAAKAGVKEEDIITHINDKEVKSADEVAKIVRENKDKVSIKLQVKRAGKSQNIEVKMPRKLKTADL
jgi:serine protease Do